MLSPKGRTNSLEVEREYFEKCQAISVAKALNGSESPVKEKHVRRILIGTFKDQNSVLFWSIVRKLPLQENPIVCWKFCHVLHKILREGHRKSLSDAYPCRGLIKDFGKMWGLLKEGYGKLIQNYCNLLLSKIEFHSRNNKFPGNLFVTDDELDNIGERDVNVLYV
ncbi:huntingtin interacting protein-like protein [Leptotrombidium deliense]|uniref:Huntingtin interacting protein-like protein n=1 Tax=Leptotrombidium deliense TaxID=299467 RepID=A0A443SBU6_9ACAR|nr:huntingtin interacting protein-like protein [Leptotrombidium deliense]